MNYQIANAVPADNQRLSAIVWQSKSHWNYPKEWMELWRDGLTITEEIITQHDVFKLLVDHKIIGCCVLITEESILWVEHLWILPAYIGQGFGRSLLQTAIQQTLQPAHLKLKVVADENAVVFYQKMGFLTVGQFASQPKGRFLPIMERKVIKNSWTSEELFHT